MLEPVSSVETLKTEAMDFCPHNCGYRASKTELEKHDTSCHNNKSNWDIFGNCAVFGCTWTGVVSKLFSHVLENHADIFITLHENLREIKFRVLKSVYLLVQFDRNYFMNEIYWMKIDEKDEKCLLNVRYAGHIGRVMKTSQKLNEFQILDTKTKEIVIKLELMEDSDQFLDISANKYNKFILKLVNNKFEQFSPYILQNLQCDICLGWLRSPILLCEMGHNFCPECTKKMKKCPICQATFSEIRNKTLESLADLLPVTCRNEECLCYGTGAEIDLHELHECGFSKITCGFIKCSATSSYDDLIRHWNRKHKKKLVRNFERFLSSLPVFEEVVDMSALNEFGSYFIASLKLVGDFYYFVVDQLTIGTKPSEFYFDVKFTNFKNEVSVNYSGQCRASTAEFIKKNKKIDDFCTWKIPRNILENICDDRGKLKVYYRHIVIYQKNCENLVLL